MCGALPITHPGVVPVNYWLPSLRESPGPAADLHAAVLRAPLPATVRRAAARPALAHRKPSPQELAAELERVMARHPAYSITTDLASGRLRYMAQARSLNSHPYLVITATLNELITELSGT
jgi:hypothetical protein